MKKFCAVVLPIDGQFGVAMERRQGGGGRDVMSVVLVVAARSSLLRQLIKVVKAKLVSHHQLGGRLW